MKIKTSELIDTALDWAVGYARCLTATNGKPILARDLMDAAVRNGMSSPSTNWAQGGPIIEREEICIKRQAPASVGYEWNAWIWTKHMAKGGSSAGGSGPTPLVAAMRCYVASKLGDEVDVPEELL